MNVSGMIYLEIDSSGRLQHFERVPPQRDEGEDSKSSETANWASLFSAAGLNMADWHAASPQWAPPFYVDSRAAWTGAVRGKPAISERIEAAQYRGQLVYFDIVHPWDTATRDQSYVKSTHEWLSEIILLSLLVLIVAASIYFGRRSAKQNRGDAKGAARIAWFVQLLFLAMWLLRAHHLASPDELDLFLIGLSWSFMLSSLARAIYFALEPFVRRNDPHTLISWSRLIAGQFKDPLVGRDLLIGAAYGILLSVYETCDNLLPLFGKLQPAPNPIAVDTLLGIRPAIGLVLQYTVIFVLYALLIFFLLFLVRLAVKRDWLVALIIAFLGAVTNTGGDYAWVTFVASAGIWLSIYFILRKFGVLALVTGLVVQNILSVYPVTTHLSRWYASGAIAGMVAILALAIYGFRIALAGQPLFGGDFLEK
jgi:serine/threonine-protein kinase